MAAFRSGTASHRRPYRAAGTPGPTRSLERSEFTRCEGSFSQVPLSRGHESSRTEAGRCSGRDRTRRAGVGRRSSWTQTSRTTRPPTSPGDARALPDLGGDRRPALRPRLPARLPADRQPARRRGPHPGGLRPRLPQPLDLHAPAPSRAGSTGSPPTSSSTRPAASSASASTPCPTSGPTGSHSALPTPDTAYADQTFDDDIERALSTLPPEFRAAVVLCDVEGLSYDEIAADPRRQARHRPLPHPPRPRHAARRARPPGTGRGPHPLPGPGRRARPASPRERVVIGHLGARVSALLDGQLSPADEERAWDHVHSCHQCRDAVEREGWVKTRLATMQLGRRGRAVPPQGLAAGARHRRLARPARPPRARRAPAPPAVATSA